MKRDHDFDVWVARQLQAVEAALSRWVPEQAPAGLSEAMRYGVLDGGKRLRPLLVLAAAEAAGARDSTAAWLLKLRTHRETGQSPRLGNTPPAGLAEVDLSRLLPNLADVEIGVRRAGRHLVLGELSGPGVRGIRVPDTDPRYLQLDHGQKRKQMMSVPAGATISVAIPRAEAVLVPQ